MKFSVTENGLCVQNFNSKSWQCTPDGRDLRNLASGGWNCWDNMSFSFIWKLCLFFLYNLNFCGEGGKNRNREQKRSESTRRRKIRTESERRSLDLLLQKQWESWPISAVCPAAFQAAAFQHYRTLSVAHQVCSLQITLLLTREAWATLWPHLPLQSFMWTPSPPAQVPGGSCGGGSEIPWVTAPAEGTGDPSWNLLPFQPSSLEVVACPHLDTLPRR